MNTTIKGRITGILKVFFPPRSPAATERVPAAGGSQKTQDLSLRLSAIYGEEKMQQQLLYERWAVKDTWHLRTEALPLLLGMDPDKYQKNEYRPDEETIKGLWQHATQCIEHGLLQVTNREQKRDEWRVEPLDIYQWAEISRLTVPDPLTAIMEFIGSTVMKSLRDKDREKILGMALAVLATYPDRCRNAGGEIKAEVLAGICKEQFRARGQETGLPDNAMLELIDKWLHVLA